MCTTLTCQKEREKIHNTYLSKRIKSTQHLFVKNTEKINTTHTCQKETNCAQHLPVKKKEKMYTTLTCQKETNCAQHIPVKKKQIVHNTYLSKRNKLCTTLTCQKRKGKNTQHLFVKNKAKMYTTHTCQKETNCAQHLPVKNNNVAQNKLPEDAILIN